MLVGNIFYHFLFVASLGNWASKMSEKVRLDRKIGFQNTFFTKCINVIIDSIGPSIILRSILLQTNSSCLYLTLSQTLCSLPNMDITKQPFSLCYRCECMSVFLSVT